ncbi:hypothetical protein [Brucella grignonensis]|uniref:hypothetical protein n=1 Tax=Brucella grignonensis TaxID=94627 RepID=UPI00142E8B91|nr:hypothetical protein [Brucella grignonensis]
MVGLTPAALIVFKDQDFRATSTAAFNLKAGQIGVVCNQAGTLINLMTSPADSLASDKAEWPRARRRRVSRDRAPQGEGISWQFSLLFPRIKPYILKEADADGELSRRFLQRYSWGAIPGNLWEGGDPPCSHAQPRYTGCEAAFRSTASDLRLEPSGGWIRRRAGRTAYVSARA